MYTNFNPRSLAGATTINEYVNGIPQISIHAPSRERQVNLHGSEKYY